MFTLWAFAFPLEPVMGARASWRSMPSACWSVARAPMFSIETTPAIVVWGPRVRCWRCCLRPSCTSPLLRSSSCPSQCRFPAPLFAVGYIAYSWYASKQNRGRINHDAHLAGACGRARVRGTHRTRLVRGRRGPVRRLSRQVRDHTLCRLATGCHRRRQQIAAVGASQSSISPAQNTPGSCWSIRCAFSPSKRTPPAVLMASSMGRGAFRVIGRALRACAS